MDNFAVISLSLLPIIGISFICYRLWGWSFDIGPFFSICLMTLILYLGGLCGVLHYTTFLILIIGYLGALAFVYAAIFRSDILPLRAYTRPGIVFFLLVAVALWFFVQGTIVHFIDEYSFWGSMSKYIYLTKALVTANSPVVIDDYPPGTALFHNLYYTVFGYSADKAYYVQDLMTIAPFCVLFQRLRWRADWFTIILTACLSIFSLLAFKYDGVQGLLVDTLLSIIFAMGFAHYLLAVDKRQAMLQLLPIIAVLPLIKFAGLLLAIFLILLIICDQGLRYQRYRARHQQRLSSGNLVANTGLMMRTGQFYPLLLLPIGVCFSVISWRYYLSSQHIVASGLGSIHYQQIIDYIRHGGIAVNLDYIHNYFYRLMYRPVHLNVFHPVSGGLTIFITILTALLSAIGVTNRWTKQRIYLLQGSLCLCYGVYIIGLLSIYLFTFSAANHLMFLSLARYHKIFVYAWLLINCAILLAVQRQMPSQLHRLLLVAMALFVFYLLPLSDEDLKAQLVSSQQIAAEVNQSGIKQINHDNLPVFVVNMDVNSGVLVFHYLLLPAKVNLGSGLVIGWKGSLSKPKLLPQSDFAAMLRQYRYLYLFNTDINFWQQYHGLFPANDQQKSKIYRVHLKGDRGVTLEPV